MLCNETIKTIHKFICNCLILRDCRCCLWENIQFLFQVFFPSQKLQNPEHGLSHKETKSFVKVYNQPQILVTKIQVQECYTLAKDSISSDICLSMPCPWKPGKEKTLVILINVAIKWPQMMAYRPCYFTFHETNLGMFSVRNTNELFHTLELSANHGIKISMISVYS